VSERKGIMAKLTPLKAIRAKCMDCTCGQFIEIKRCTIEKCPLYEYRMGHRPPKEEIPEEGLAVQKS
jgi:hypothetical protein